MNEFRSIAARLMAAVLALIAAPVSAALVTTPPGLNPGDQYRLAFVTSSATTAASGSIATYNTFVTNRANTQAALVALGTTWTAIASTTTVDARDNTGTNPASTGVPIYLLDGSKIADNNADLWDGTLDHVLNFTETGGVLAVQVWTGTASNGTGSLAVNATQLGTQAAGAGSSNSASATWMLAAGYDSATAPLPLYAVSGVLVVAAPAVPPSIEKAFSTGIVGLDDPSPTMTITISNPGSNTVPLTGVAFTDTFPAGLVVATPNQLTNSCGGTATAVSGSGSVTLTGGTLAVGATCTVTVAVSATMVGTLVNTTGAVTSVEGGSGQNASATLVATPPAIPALGMRELLLLSILLAVAGAIALRSNPFGF